MPPSMACVFHSSLVLIPLLIVVPPSNSQFDIQIPITPLVSSGFQTKISLESKQVYGTHSPMPVNVDITEPLLQICCKPNNNIIDIVLSFLSNPFFRINEYICPDVASFKASQIKLPAIGVLTINHTILEYPQCHKGIFGLSKLSTFLDALPRPYQTIRIEVSRDWDREEVKAKGFVGVAFGQFIGQSDGFSVLESPSDTLWDFNVDIIELGNLAVDQNCSVVFTSTGSSILIPSKAYNNIVSYFVKAQNCKLSKQTLYCLCESGIPTFFPKLTLKPNKKSPTLTIPPQSYMQLDSNLCSLQLQNSPTSTWSLNIQFFPSSIFYLDRQKKQILIQKKQEIHNQTSELIHLPIQLILNCAVVLLLCIFVSLVLIEVVKRVWRLPEGREENLRQYLLQRNLAHDS